MYIGIIRDGHSDYRVIRKFVFTIFQHYHKIELDPEKNFFELDLNINNAVAKYLDDSHKKSNSHKEIDSGLFSSYANDLKRDLKSVLFTALKKFQKDDITLSNHDLIVVYSDAEKVLNARQNYFTNDYYNINVVIRAGIEDFYEQMTTQGYLQNQLPLILPLILFPSSEILVAACKKDFSKKELRKLKAKDLKQIVYETHDIPTALEEGKLDEVLDNYLVPEHIEEIYKEIPEVRQFIQILSFPGSARLA